MKYYRVKEEYDQTYLYNITLIAGELFTEKEFQSICVDEKYFDVINISSRKTFKIHGIRFISHEYR